MTQTIRPGIIPFWMMNDASTVAEKIEFMRACRAGGVEALCMHPRAGNLIPYATDEWFAMVSALVEEGKRLGMQMWLYDEDPFPSGAAGGLVMTERPELSARVITRHVAPASLKPGDLWPISHQQVLWAGLTPVSRPAPAEDLSRSVGPVRQDWFMTRWDSRYYYEETEYFDAPRGSALNNVYSIRVPKIPRGYRLEALTAEVAVTDNSWGGIPDLLNRDSFPLYKSLTFDRYEAVVGQHYGRTIPGMFTDEAKPGSSMPYTREMFASFEDTYGYDLRGRVYQLFGPPLGEEYEKTRVDYRRWVAERFLDVFVKPYARYCKQQGLLLVGHFSPEDDPIAESHCLGSVMPIMKQMGCPGTDVIVPYVGDRRAATLNLGSFRAGSLRSQTSQPYATSETLALSGWDVTSKECRRILAWQKVLGIDRYFIHGFYDSNEGIQNYECPPDYGPYSAIFQGMGAINDWLRRLEPVLDGANDTCDTALLNSVVSFWTWSPDYASARHKRLRRSLWKTLLACLRSHVGVQSVDEDDLAKARVVKGRLRIGRRSYARVLVPAIDFMGEAALQTLRAAVSAGVDVVWFGGGPKRLLNARHDFVKVPSLPGKVLTQGHPSEGWIRREVPRAVTVTGKTRGDCYVRCFHSKAGKDYVLAVNLCEEPVRLGLEATDGPGLQPVADLVDGEITVKGPRVTWKAPARGVALLRVGRGPVRQVRRGPVRALDMQGLTFERSGANLLRLNQPTVTINGEDQGRLDYARPLWELSSDYEADEDFPTFAGTLPIRSRVKDADARYRFVFSVRGDVKAPRLILDPRCARGRFVLTVNGKTVGGKRRFPLGRIQAVRVHLSNLKRGKNTVELRFTVTHAMEGLLSQLYVEGDFDVDVTGDVPTISPPRHGITREGWQAAGMPHYMGSGVYRWEETLSRGDAGKAWSLELDDVVDSAVLTVNGKSVGTRAWEPWKWELPSLKTGRNRFELIVSGTAGNKHKLDWPNQPQGWIGGGRLVGRW